MTEMPIIRLELQAMTAQMVKALWDRNEELCELVSQAVDAYCTEGHLAEVVSQQARATLDTVVREEVGAFFRYGKGREVVRASVLEYLNDVYGEAKTSDE